MKRARSTIFLILAGTAIAVGQLMFPHRRIVEVLPSKIYPTNSAAYWWVANDLTNQQSPGTKVTNWVDRIQGEQLNQSVNTRRPTFTTNGTLYTWATLYLTNVGTMPAFESGTYLFISEITDLGGGGRYDIWGEGNVTTHPICIRGSGAGNTNFAIINSGGTIYNFGGMLSTGKCMLAVSVDKVGTGNYSIFGYTNNILASTYTSQAVSPFMAYKYFGGNDSDFSPNWYVKEVLVWTNALTTNEINLMWEYSTNKYGSP